jgi:hypothetical protein
MPEGIAETDAEKQDPRLASRNLVADFPEMFADAFDVSVPNGWYSVVWECCSAIHEVAPETRIAQVKEKFGGLRIYLDTESTDEIDALIQLATYQCNETCQDCGKPGWLHRKGGWLATRCEACRG